MRLSHKDQAALDQAIFELYDPRDLRRFRGELSAVLLKLVPSDYFFWHEYEIDLADGKTALADFVESDPFTTKEVVDDMGALILKHPFTHYFVSGGEPETLKMSDFLTSAQFSRSSISDTYHRWGKFKHTISVPTSASIGKAAALGFCGGNRDFTERDRLVMNLLRRHFDRAHRNAKLATARQKFPALSLKDYRLTPREIEIALWLARGKTNREISMILQGSLRTIEKHVEHILQKLNVENRAAATGMIGAAMNSSES